MPIFDAPASTARIYASQTMHKLAATICPGGLEHEGRGAGALYCDACLRIAFIEAWTAGNLARWTHGQSGSSR